MSIFYEQTPNPEDILFLDVESVAQFPRYEDTDERSRELWNKKASFLKAEEGEDTPEKLYSRAGIYSEFGKIICISTGFLQQDNGIWKFRVKSFYNDDEKVVLQDFAQLLLHKKFSDPVTRICGHNVREFDVPYIARRMVINSIDLPPQLRIAGKKPWEVSHLDTMELWKFGDFKNFTSLDLLSHVLGIPSPKTNMDGSMVNDVYHKEHDLERIRKYCEQDVVTTANVLLRLLGKDLIAPENVVSMS